jgi:hypothetical protein
MLKKHLAAFTEDDYKLLNTLWKLVRSGERKRLDEKAAILLGIEASTVRSRLSRMNIKYEACKRYLKEYRSWQQRLYQKSGGKFHSL